MSENKANNKQKQKSDNVDEEEITLKKVSLGEKKLEFYYDIIKIPIILVTVINVVYYLLKGSFELMWVFDIIAFIYVASIIIRKSNWKKFEIFIACGLTGFFLGFFAALFEFIYVRKFYLFFKIISEPVITFFVGGFVGLAIAYSYKNLNKQNKKEGSSSRKGGDLDGREKR